MPLSTFLCIDLTSNWQKPIARPSISLSFSKFEKFSYITKLLNYLRLFAPRTHLKISPFDIFFLSSQCNFIILSFSQQGCKVFFVVFLAIKNPLAISDPFTKTPEVPGNIRLTPLSIANFFILCNSPRKKKPPALGGFFLVGLDGLEPPTSSLSVTRSNQLSYSPSRGGRRGARTPDPLGVNEML